MLNNDFLFLFLWRERVLLKSKKGLLLVENFKIRQLVLSLAADRTLEISKEWNCDPRELGHTCVVLKVLFDQENSSSSFFEESVTKPGCANKNQSLVAAFCSPQHAPTQIFAGFWTMKLSWWWCSYSLHGWLNRYLFSIGLNFGKWENCRHIDRHSTVPLWANLSAFLSSWHPSMGRGFSRDLMMTEFGSSCDNGRDGASTIWPWPDMKDYNFHWVSYYLFSVGSQSIFSSREALLLFHC